MKFSRYAPIILQEPSSHDADDPPNIPLDRTRWHAWIVTIRSLVLHLVMSLGLIMFMIHYVNGNHFNLDDRLPWTPITDANGERVRWDRPAPLQSDITTIISAWLVILRLNIAAWTTALGWRGAFLLMSTAGLKSQNLKQLVRYGFLSPTAYTQNSLVPLVSATLLVNMVALSVTPILTGSISWMPSNTPARRLTNTTVSVPAAFHSDEWERYQMNMEWRKRVTVQGAGLVAASWQSSDNRRVLKRALHGTAGLNVNSTIANVTLPYFSVISLEWLSDPIQQLSPYQRDVDRFWHNIGVGDGKTSLTVPGTVALIPDQNTTWRSTPFPSPSTASETRMLVLYTSRLVGTIDSTCRLDNSNISNILPSDLGLLHQDQFCYAFARVTYEAGASVCTECRLSSPNTVQNDTQMVLEADLMTNEALWMMPDVANQLVLANTSIPSSWGDLDDYVSELLIRSYSGAWNGLNQWIGNPGAPLKSDFSITVPAIKAQVHLGRVYAWFGTQLLAIFFNVIFLVGLAKSRHPLLGDTSMVPFYVDSLEVPTHKLRGRLRAIPSGDRWRVQVDHEKP
ncbi:hypothetical protein FRC11_006901 [Ceratobasidium sp. 423]|nr:hypothetical protein FRC11_006901 [Ceratobasidium sp. 423]